MPSKRYFLYHSPVAHMNGKLTRVADKVKHQPDTDKSDTSFYYGYKHRSSDRSRYGLRERARNLSVNPYTQGEEDVHNLFRASAQTGASVMNDNTKRQKAYSEYTAKRLRRQTQYTTFWGYTFATIFANGGISPW